MVYDDTVANWLEAQAPTQKELQKLMVQLYWLSFQHRRIAQYNYTAHFLSTHDIWAYFEYLYHRVSSLRYLTFLYRLMSNHREV